MARVISWVIDNKYVYIKPQNGRYILDSKLSNEATRQLGSEVTGWGQETYRTNFEAMYAAVTAKWGSATDLRNDYMFYFNATGEEGVYMLTGIDGANTADYGKPFYNLCITNNNTSIGLGGDYRLDVDATLKTQIYLERNGDIFLPERAVVKYDGRVVHSTTRTEEGLLSVYIDIPNGTLFDGELHSNEYTIEAYKDSWSGKTLFTVVGVKDGEEGVSYDLLVIPKQIKVTADGVNSDESVSCKALRNGVDVGNDGNIVIKYNFGEATEDADDLSNVYSSPISYATISENGDQVNFYLLYKGKIVDMDSCTVSRDGQDGGSYARLELFNEIDGVAVGDDTDLDLETGQTVVIGTTFSLYSGSTELALTDVKLDGVYNQPAGSTAVTLPYYTEAFSAETYNTSNGSANINGAIVGGLRIILGNGFEFGDDYREAIKVIATGTNDLAEEATATATYVVMGVRGGKDGDVYRIIPNLDVVEYNPNSEENVYVVDNEPVEYLTASAYLGLEPFADGEIRWSADITYKDQYNSTRPYTDMSIPIMEHIESGTSYITFYLWITDDNGEKILVDRETVPFIRQGMDGSSVWIELGNEIDAVSVGNDTDLDLDEELTAVTIGTTVRIMSGGTPVAIRNVTITPPAGTEANWRNHASWEWIPEANNPKEGEIRVTLYDQFEFGLDYRESLRVNATADTEDSWTGFTKYVIKAIKGGKDGYVYRLQPEVDYVHVYPNQNDIVDEHQLLCTAFYGKEELGSPDASWEGKIWYSINKLCKTTGETSSNPQEYITGMTEYTTQGVNLDGITKNNYTYWKYVVFYLEVDGEIVDRETVPIVSDGLDAHDNVVVELTNEIDSIGVGSDSKLDIGVNESVSAMTGVRLFSGATPMQITKITVSGWDDPNPAHYMTKAYVVNQSGVETSTEVSPSNPSEKVNFYAFLLNQFEFGSDLKERLVLTVEGKNSKNETASGYATFVLAGIKGGKDGVIYKVQPTPDYVLYDLQTSEWGGTVNSVSAYAFANGIAMNKDYTENTDYQIKITRGAILDLDNATTQWGSGAFTNYREGSPLGFDAPTTSSREQLVVFYLAIKLEDSNSWVVVDRETVPIIVSGKEGKDGIGSIVFDLSNENWVITTGEDTYLDLARTLTGGTYVTCSSGNTHVALHVATSSTDDLSYASVEILNNDTVEPFVKVTLTGRTDPSTTQGFNFGPNQRKEITVECTTPDGFSGSRVFGLVCVKNGAGGKEGLECKLKTNAARIFYNAELDKYGPSGLTLYYFEGEENKTSSIKFKYRIFPMNEIGEITNPNPTLRTINPASNPVISDFEDVTLGSISITACTTSDEYRDSCEIPIEPLARDGKGGSGLVAELTNEIETLALGSDMILLNDDPEDQRQELWLGVSYATLFNNTTALEITKCVLDVSSVTVNNKVMDIHVYPGTSTTEVAGASDADGVKYEFGNNSPTKVGLRVRIDKGFDFSEIDSKQEFMITLYTEVEDEETSTMVEVNKSVKYTVLGVRAGKDGNSYNLAVSAASIKYNPNSADKFFPGEVLVSLWEGKRTMRDTEYILKYIVNDIDIENVYEVHQLSPEDGTYYTIDLDDAFSGEVAYECITVYAYLITDDPNDPLFIDKEIIHVVSDGKDGEGAARFDLTNMFEIINTGDDTVLNLPSGVQYKDYSTVIYGYSGATKTGLTNVEVDIVPQSLPQHFNAFTAATSDNGVRLTVRLEDGFDFGQDQKMNVPISATIAGSNPVVTGSLTFSLLSIMNGSSEEGSSYKLRTNVNRFVYESNDWSPQVVYGGLYLGDVLQYCKVYFMYSVTPLSMAEMMNESTYQNATHCQNIIYGTGSGEHTTVSGVSITAVTNGIQSFAETDTIYIAAFSGGTFLDAEALPVQVVSDPGSSGLLADLTDDVGVVGVGGNGILESSVTLSTTIFAREGSSRLDIVDIQLPSLYTDSNGGTISFSAPGFTPNTPGRKAVNISITITADETDFIDFRSANPKQFTISASARTLDNEVVQVSKGYSILGLKEGKDGATALLLLNADQIFFDQNMVPGPGINRFEPGEILARLFLDGEDITNAAGVTFDIKNSDMATPTQTEAWMEFDGIERRGSGANRVAYGVFTLSEDNISEFDPLTIRAKSGNTVLDWETVQVLRDGKDGEGLYKLDLDNQNAGINCDASGNILAGAERPQCTATLYYGGDPASEGTITYSISIANKYQAAGISINASTGQLHFNLSNESPSLYWSGTTLQIEVYGLIDGVAKGKAIMNVSKNMPGADGESSVTYWLVPSANAIKVDSGGTPYPATVSCAVWKQVGEGTPTSSLSNDEPKIYYGYNTTSPQNQYNGSPLTIDITKNYLTFELYKDGVQYDIETIPILHDGTVGQTVQGRQGAAVLGPTLWEVGMTRRWHSGNENFVLNRDLAEASEDDLLFLDIIIREENNSNVYYHCVSSYTQHSQDTWNTVKNWWVSADTQYNFVASNLILSEAAKINFITNSELYLMDANGDICGGAKAVTTGVNGNDVIFWAGSDNPTTAPFRVDYNGNLIATSGVFSGYIQMPYTFVSELNTVTMNLAGIGGHSSHIVYRADHRAYLVSDSGNTTPGSGGEIWVSSLMLPEPTQANNGMMYEVIVDPAENSTGVKSLLIIIMGGNTYTSKSARSGNKKFQTLAFCERYEGDNILLYGGRYQFVCIPRRTGNLSVSYTWAITMANGQFMLDKYVSSTTAKQYLLNPVFSYREEQNNNMPTTADTINKITVYSGTKQTVEKNNYMTLYVSRD